MLVFYNESNTPWKARKINDYIGRVEMTKEINHATKATRTIGITIPGNIELDTIEQVKNCYVPKTLFNGGTNILFQHKSCSPRVIANSKYNKDIMFINLNIGNDMVVDIETENTFILNYIIMKGELVLIVAVSDKDNKGVNIKLYNQMNNTTRTYHFIKEDDKYTLNVDETENVNAAEGEYTPYVFKKFRPASPTQLIYAMERDMYKLGKTINVENHIIKSVEDYSSLINSVDEMVDQKYTAATLFINKPNLKNESRGNSDYYDILETIEDKFKTVNILLNNGKVVKR